MTENWSDWLQGVLQLSGLGKFWSALTMTMGDDGLLHAELEQNDVQTTAAGPPGRRPRP